MSNHQSQQDTISSSVLGRLPFPPSPRLSPVTPTCSQFIAHAVDGMVLVARIAATVLDGGNLEAGAMFFFSDHQCLKRYLIK